MSKCREKVRNVTLGGATGATMRKRPASRYRHCAGCELTERVIRDRATRLSKFHVRRCGRECR